MNQIVAMMVLQVAMLSPIFLDMFGNIFDLPFLGTVMLAVRIIGPTLGFVIVTALPLLVFGGFTALVGAKWLSRLDT